MPKYSIMYRNTYGREDKGEMIIIESNNATDWCYADWERMTSLQFDTEFDAIRHLITTDKNHLTQTLKNVIDSFLSSTKGAKLCLDMKP